MSTTLHTTYYNSPLGAICITGTEAGIASVKFCEEPGISDEQIPAPLANCLVQLAAYFKGELKEFDLPLLPEGTLFQKQVWEQLQTVSFGTTASYLTIARAVSGEKAIRAVGGANGRNPICIIVPCHRIIGSDGSLTGYSGGLWRKEWLLKHEGVLQPEKQLSIF